MAVYLISYDLKSAQSHDYSKLHDKIRSFGNAISILESTWLVDTKLNAQAMSDQIKSVYQPEKHFVQELTKGSDNQGVLFKDHWTWIQQRL